MDNLPGGHQPVRGDPAEQGCGRTCPRVHSAADGRGSGVWGLRENTLLKIEDPEEIREKHTLFHPQNRRKTKARRKFPVVRGPGVPGLCVFAGVLWAENGGTRGWGRCFHDLGGCWGPHHPPGEHVVDRRRGAVCAVDAGVTDR